MLRSGTTVDASDDGRVRSRAPAQIIVLRMATFGDVFAVRLLKVVWDRLVCFGSTKLLSSGHFLLRFLPPRLASKAFEGAAVSWSGALLECAFLKWCSVEVVTAPYHVDFSDASLINEVEEPVVAVKNGITRAPVNGQVYKAISWPLTGGSLVVIRMGRAAPPHAP